MTTEKTKIKGWKTYDIARRRAREVSVNGTVRGLGDGTYVAIGDAAPDRGSAIFHRGGMTYASDLDPDQLDALAD